jgi:hypothetical protein
MAPPGQNCPGGAASRPRGILQILGAFPCHGSCARWRPVAFLGETEPRAARPGRRPASNPSGLSTPAGECKTPGHFSGTAGTSPALLYRPLLWPQSGWVPWRHWRKGGWAMVATRANFSAGGTPWERADLFFLCDALSRGMSIQDLAGFLNRSVDEVKQQADSHCHDSVSSSDDSASKPPAQSDEPPRLA